MGMSKCSIFEVVCMLFIFVSYSKVEPAVEMMEGCPAGMEIGWRWYPIPACMGCECSGEPNSTWTSCYSCGVVGVQEGWIKVVDLTKNYPGCCPTYVPPPSTQSTWKNQS